MGWNVKFIHAKQAKEIHQYQNTKRKLYRTNAAIWYNKTRREHFQPIHTIGRQQESMTIPKAAHTIL
jgi:hypothetical protein